MKTISSRISLLSLATLLGLPFAAQARFSVTPIPLTAATDANLQNNTIYEVNESLTLPAVAGSSKFRVLGNNVVAINIKKGVTLTLKGGDATGETGAGAAISVASGATLYIMGEGTLVATGGAAGNGCGGSSGGNGWVGSDENRGKGGTGGTGGKGGGGGAAAIGGVGGDGGNGGGGGSGKEKVCSRGAFSSDGDSGSPGSSGSNGGGMGRVVIIGNVTVKATAGAAATADGSGGGSGSKGYYKWTNAYVAGGGGGGGGGARGQDAQYGIGGGGAGGAGGGGGGGGGTVCNSAGGDATGWGDGGSGGKSYTSSSGSSGTRGGSRSVSLYYGSAKGGGGGEGGAANTKRGDNGTLEIGPSVKFTSTPSRASNTPLLAVPSGLYETALHFFSQNVEVGTVAASLMLEMPGATEVTRNGYRFLGYFTVEEGEAGGRCVYGPDYKPSSPVWESVEDSVNLYAHWEVAPTMLVVNTNEDGENLGQGKITLRDAMRELCASPTLTGTNGLRRIEFDLPADDGKNVIALTNVIAVNVNTSPIEIDGFNGGKGVTITAGGNYNALQLSGSDVNLRCLNFKNCPKHAIVHSGGLTVVDCSFIGNRGAIQSGNDAELEVLNCTFADNNAAGGGGAVAMADTSVYGTFVNCTFARNKASSGSAVHSAKAELTFIHCTLVPGDANALVSASGIATYFLNTLIAKPSGGTAVTAGTTTSICSSLGTQDQSAILNPAQADDLLGVRHIWYEPVQSSASGNRDAAPVFYDANIKNLAIVTNGVKKLLYGDNVGLATMPIGIDQLHGARMAPVRGSIRIATGVQPPVVNVEGVAWGLTNATVTANATVLYDDGTYAEKPVTVKTNGDAVFGTAVEVDGSDLYTHNVTEVRLNGLAGDHNMTVATSPYALVASSASAIATEDSEVCLPGDEIRVTTALADSLVVSKLAVGGEAFSAGSLAGFQNITLDDVNVRGGSLRVLGSNSKDGGAQMANLDNKTIGGGEMSKDATGSLNGTTKSWTADYDGFVQISVEASNVTSSGQVGLTVGNVTVTPMGALGAGGSRTAVWTVPVRKGEVVTLHANGVTVGYKTQFIYFGVKE